MRDAPQNARPPRAKREKPWSRGRILPKRGAGLEVLPFQSRKNRTLRDLKPGEAGVVLSVGGQGALKRRLVDMGITPGTGIAVLRVAPLGDPIEIRLRGYTLSLRREEAARIAVLWGPASRPAGDG